MASTAFLPVECDVPDGVTLTQWRRERIAQVERRRPAQLRRRRVLRLAFG